MCLAICMRICSCINEGYSQGFLWVTGGTGFRSVLPVAPSIPPLCLGSVSTLLPLKQNPHLGSKQQTFMSQSQPKSFQGIIGLTLSQFQLLRCHGRQPQPVHVSYLNRRRHENRHVLWGYCLPSIRIFIKMWI